MKKILLIILVLISLICFSSCKKTPSNQINPEEHLQVKLNLSEDFTSYEVIGAEEGVKDLIIPDEYKGKPIKTIKEFAFKDNKELNSVIIGNNVELIESFAFRGCYNLFSIVVGQKVKMIRTNAFLDCNSLVEVYNKSQLTLEIGNTSNGLITKHALILEHEYESFKVQYPKDYVLLNTNDTTYILKYVGEETKVSIPTFKYPIIIYNNAFYENDKITSVVFANTIKKIGSYAFSKCYNLEKIELNEGLEYLGDNAFDKCYSLITLSIPQSLKAKGQNIFLECFSLVEIYNLSNVDVKENETKHFIKDVYESKNTLSKKFNVDDFVFYKQDDEITLIKYFGKEEYVELPNLNCLYKVGPGAFINNQTAKLINFNGYVEEIGESAFEKCSKITFVENNNNLKIINSSAFYECFQLMSFNLPKTLVKIEDNAFMFCYRLAEIFNESNLVIDLKSNTNGNIACYSYVCHNSLDDESSLIYIDDFIFINDDNKTYLINYIGQSSNVVLPSYYTKETYEISTGAFIDLDFIEYVETYDYISEINSFSFAYCDNLKIIKLGSNVNYIGEYSFYQCPNLSQIIFTNPVDWKVSSDSFTIYKKEEQINAFEVAKYFKNNTNFNFKRIL